MKLRTPDEARLGEAAMALIRAIEDEAIGWETDDPIEDDDEIDLELVVLRWFGKSLFDAYRQLKEIARG